MKIAAIAAVLSLAFLTGCSSDRDEEAFLDSVYERNADYPEFDYFTDDTLIAAGEAACAMQADGTYDPPEGDSYSTGVPWHWVWWSANANLCPDVEIPL